MSVALRTEILPTDLTAMMVLCVIIKKELFFHAIVKRKALLLRMKTVLYL